VKLQLQLQLRFPDRSHTNIPGWGRVVRMVF
jgi:hypothetical protein